MTSAEAVLVSLQSHTEVLNTLDAHPSLPLPWLQNGIENGLHNGTNGHKSWISSSRKIFVASVSPQTRASLAATFNVSSAEAGNMLEQLLSGPLGLATGGAHGSSFLWIFDTNNLRDMALVMAAEEVESTVSRSSDTPKKPILTSACPGWICYAEKTHPHVLPHLSRLKSPQALAGTLLKSVLSRKYGIPPSQIWHLAIMPCFDKKLEASRSELTSASWSSDGSASVEPVRDVDCVITAREVLSLCDARGLSFAALPRTSLPCFSRTPFPDPLLDAFLFPRRRPTHTTDTSSGSSGGFLWHALRRAQAAHAGSRIAVARGRNADVLEYTVVRGGGDDGALPADVLFRAARYYGFRNIQNLVRRLRPPRASKLRGGGARPGTAPAAGLEYDFVEVMACPGGCTNGGGQIRAGEVGEGERRKVGPQEQREWLARVDEAYFSAESDEEGDDRMDVDVQSTDGDVVDGISKTDVRRVLAHWADVTGVPPEKLVFTSYRAVESDVGKTKKNDIEKVAGLASSIGGGW